MMGLSRFLAAVLVIWAWTSAAVAQDFSGLARVDASNSRIVSQGKTDVLVTLHLSQGVPYRLFTLNTPPRLVLDFQEVDWSGLTSDTLVQSARIAQVQFGTYVPGWSRMVVDLDGPMGVDSVGLQVDDTGRGAVLDLILTPVTAERFAATAGAPQDPRWDLPEPANLPAARTPAQKNRMMVVLDPGHGGLDPGAETDTINEKTLMLTFARELSEALVRSGEFDVILTRETDHFVSLERRISIAHQADADVFISLHADSLSEGLAHGATVHVLSREASDIASAKLAERHDRGDLLSGVDLSTADDQVTDILLDLARQETQPRTEALARSLVEAMAQTGGPMNRRPLRSAAFSVLKAADIPSVLIEIGFLTSPRDLKNLQNQEWRIRMASAIRAGLQAWRDADAALRPLVRK